MTWKNYDGTFSASLSAAKIARLCVTCVRTLPVEVEVEVKEENNLHTLPGQVRIP